MLRSFLSTITTSAVIAGGYSFSQSKTEFDKSNNIYSRYYQNRDFVSWKYTSTPETKEFKISYEYK